MGGSKGANSSYRNVAVRWVAVMTLGNQKVQQKVTLHESYPGSILKQGTAQQCQSAPLIKH